MKRVLNAVSVDYFYCKGILAAALKCSLTSVVSTGTFKKNSKWWPGSSRPPEQTGQKVAEAELYRLKGELLMLNDPGNVVESERHLRTAIEVARRQTARLFELRATVSLARLITSQARRDEARSMLTDI